MGSWKLVTLLIDLPFVVSGSVGDANCHGVQPRSRVSVRRSTKKQARLGSRAGRRRGLLFALANPPNSTLPSLVPKDDGNTASRCELPLELPQHAVRQLRLLGTVPGTEAAAASTGAADRESQLRCSHRRGRRGGHRGGEVDVSGAAQGGGVGAIVKLCEGREVVQRRVPLQPWRERGGHGAESMRKKRKGRKASVSSLCQQGNKGQRL